MSINHKKIFQIKKANPIGKRTINRYYINYLQSGKICTQSLKTFPCDIIYTLSVKEADLPPLLLVSGYVARKTMGETECSSCKAMFGSLEKPFSLDINPEHFTYFDPINRGGLMFPTNFFFNIILCGYFQFVYFKRLLALEYNTLIGIMEHYCVNNHKYSGLLLSCDMCKT